MHLWLRRSLWVALSVVVIMGTSAPCSAQSFEAVGVRALGMAGAFVAVANDASAAYWNPAGLAKGDFFSAVVDRTTGDVRVIGETLPEVPATRASGTLVAVAVPSLGASYYRLTSATRRLRPDAALGPTVVESLVTSQFGATLLQSLSENLVVGSTLKLVHGSVKRGTSDFDVPAEEALDSLDDLDGEGNTEFDLDLGVMLLVGAARIGLTARNMREPAFDTPEGDALSLERQVRLGVAVLPARQTTIAADVDLRTTASAIGDQRHLAIGAEQWVGQQRRLGVRGGIRINTVDERRPSASAGLSLGVSPKFYVDLQITRGDNDADRSWSVGGRIGY